MRKILSIIIPTYNMDALLPRCLDSLVSAGCVDSLDILVVNDGSRDNSLEVAKGYQGHFPQSVRVIDKPNGNYGSTINAALPLAQGQYVRILDSDDMYDTPSLDGFIETLSQLDVAPDVCICHFVRSYVNKTESVKYIPMRYGPLEYGKVYGFDSVIGNGNFDKLYMHAVTYRTDMLRDMGYVQTEGVSYTDEEWVSYPLYVASTIAFFDQTVYRYNMDREGQTMDAAVRARSIKHIETVLKSQMSFYQGFPKTTLSTERLSFVQKELINKIKLTIRYELQDFPQESFSKERFSSLDSDLQAFFKNTGLPVCKVYPYNRLIHFDMYRYWHIHQSRMPAAIQAMNRLADRLVRRVFTLFFG